MKQSAEQAIKLFEETYTRWAKLRHEGRLMRGDEAPDPVSIGVDAWAADQIRKRVDREIARTT